MQIVTPALIILALIESFTIHKDAALVLGITLSCAGIVAGAALAALSRRFDKYSFTLSFLVAVFFVTLFSGLAFLGRASGAWSIWGD
jgi:small basic protein